MRSTAVSPAAAAAFLVALRAGAGFLTLLALLLRVDWHCTARVGAAFAALRVLLLRVAAILMWYEMKGRFLWPARCCEMSRTFCPEQEESNITEWECEIRRHCCKTTMRRVSEVR